MPDHVAVAVGCFADPTFPPPTTVAWTAEQHAWVRFPEGCRSFERLGFCQAAGAGRELTVCRDFGRRGVAATAW